MHKSVVCPEKESDSTVTCCLNDEKRCAESLQQLPDFLFTGIQQVRELYDQDQFELGRVPNCHWLTTSYLKNQLEEWTPVSELFLWGTLRGPQWVEVSPEQMESGDVVIFLFEGKMRVEPMTPGGKWGWKPTYQLEHSALALGPDLLIQKENYGTQVFSVATLKQSQKAYEEAFFKSPSGGRMRGQMKVKVFRSR